MAIDWGGLLGSAIGGWAGAQGTPDQTTTQEPTYLPGQEEGLTNFLNASKQQFQQGPQQYYPGQTVAGLDPNTIASQNAALGTLGQQGQLGQAAAQGAMNLAGGGDRVGGFQLQDQIGFGIDPGLQSAVTNPIMSQLDDRINSMNLAATSQGAFGGSRAQQMKGGAVADATGQMTDALARANLQARGQSIGQRAGDISAQLQGRSQDIGQNQLANQAMQAGLGAIPGAQQSLLAGSQLQGAVGADRMAYEQSLLNADKARFDFGQQAGIDQIDRLGQRMNMVPTGQVTTDQGTPGNITNILGGALSGWNVGSGFTGGSQGGRPMTPNTGAGWANDWAGGNFNFGGS